MLIRIKHFACKPDYKGEMVKTMFKAGAF